MMVVLGIDPGTQRIGYGIVRHEGNSLSLLDAGLLSVKEKGARSLYEIKAGVDLLIKKHKPDVLAIEKLFFVKNQKTGLAVAEARGVILLSALEREIPVVELTPTEIKMGLTGYGASDKQAVLKMVRLTLKEPGLTVIDDVSDAIAAAIVARQNMKTKR